MSDKILDFEITIDRDRAECVLREINDLIKVSDCEKIKLMFIGDKLSVIPIHSKIEITL